MLDNKIHRKLFNIYTVPKLLLVAQTTNLFCDSGNDASLDDSCTGGSEVDNSDFCITGTSNIASCMSGGSATLIRFNNRACFSGTGTVNLESESHGS